MRMLARLKNALAHVRIQRALEQLSSDEDVRALEKVRESIQRTLAEAGVNREIAGTGSDEKLAAIRPRNAETKAQAELAELKRTRRRASNSYDIVPVKVTAIICARQVFRDSH